MSGNQEGSGYSPIERRKNRAFRPRQFREMTIGNLFRGFDPSWSVRDVMIVGDEHESYGISSL